jgi:phage terminase large subunit
MLKYTPRDAFLPFHNRKQRWAVLCTHRRAGKTVALVNDIIYGALECQGYRPQLAYVGPTFKQAKRIAWQYLKDYAEPYLQQPPSESELKIVLQGDRTIFCLGADNADSLRGMYLDGGVGDEYAMFKPSVFSQIIRPALSDRKGWWAFTSTPRGKNLFYKEYKKALASPDVSFALNLPADKSGIIDAGELEELRRDMDPEEFAQEYLCSFDSALKGAIYADEVNQVMLDGRLRSQLYDAALPFFAVFDLGFTDATVCILWQEAPDGTIRVVGVNATTGKDIFHHIEQLHQLPGELAEVHLPHDARAKNLQTGKSIVEQFLKEFMDTETKVRMVPAHKVRDRISATRRVFPRIHFEETVCDDLIEALKGYRREWDETKLMFSDTPLHDWCSDYADSFGYLAVVAGERMQKLTQSKYAVANRTQQFNQYNLDQLFADHKQSQSLRRMA